jgi:PAS domain S-box-containing protein
MTDQANFQGSWWRYRILAAIAVLFLTEIVLLVAVVAQDRRRLQLEKLLFESEERMAFAAEAADLGLWRWEAAHDRFWSTAHCREMFGIPHSAEYTMTAMTDAIHSEDRTAVTLAMQNGIRSGLTYELQYRVRLGDGQLRWVRTRARSYKNQDGKVVRIAGTVTNISEHKKMQAEVERQQQSLAHLARVGVIGELSGALAHELNQPLTAILSNAQAIQRMIKQQPLNLAELEGAIADIIEDDSRAGDVIRHLRALLKKDETHHDLLNVNDLVTNALHLTRSDLISRRVATVTQLFPGRLPVKGDAVQIQQLLLNLILNASEAMSDRLDSGGVLMIASDLVSGNHVHLSISDTGPGIDPDLMAKLFDAFFTTKAHGLGLGLSICRAIVLRHGGKIWAENNPGEGATFHIYLPLSEGAAP